jgi:hypothetical protein
MKKILWLFCVVLVGCTAMKKEEETAKIEFAKSLKQAVENYAFGFRDSEVQYYSGFTYYKYINRVAAKSSLILSDSIKVENLWLVFYKFSINGHDYHQSDWYINIKGNYCNAGIYIGTYNVEECFDRENVDLVKALIEKADLWEKKSEKRWWKFVD